MKTDAEIESNLVQLHQALSAYLTGQLPLHQTSTMLADCDANIAGCKILFPNSEKIFELCLCEQDKIILQPDRLYRFTVDETCRHCKMLADKGNPIPKKDDYVADQICR